jgi:hypothetical protein
LVEARDTDKALFLGMSVRMFLEAIGVWISELSKKDLPLPSVGWSTIQLGEGQDRRERKKKNKFTLSSGAGVAFFSCPMTSDL